MTAAVKEIALATATRLGGSSERGSLERGSLERGFSEPEALRAEVEAELEHEDGAPRAYADPVSIASLIVAIASLAWNIYSELRRSPRELADEVRGQWAADHEVDGTTGAVIDVVAEETVKYSER